MLKKLKNYNATKMFKVVKAVKCELYLKISQWTQAWAFPAVCIGTC